MRGLRSTIALIVVLAGLGGVHLFFVTVEDAGQGDGRRREGEGVRGAAGRQDRRDHGDVGGRRRDDAEEGRRRLADDAPVAVKADEIGSVRHHDGVGVDSTSSGSSTRIPTNLNDYGLSKPRIEVDFKASGDATVQKLLIGEKSPTGADLFAKRNDEKRVFLIPAFQETTLNRTTFDLRDKTLLKFDREKVDGIDVTADGKTLALAKDGGDWKITKPLQTRADFGSVEGLVGRLQTAQMKSIVTNEPTPADLKKYGLDKPQATVNLNAGSARATLLVGGKAEDNTRLRARCVEAGGRHGRQRAPRRLQEGRRRLSPQGSLRVPPVQRHAHRAHAQRPDGRARPGEGPGRERAGQVAPRQPEPWRRGQGQDATACSRSCRTCAPRRSWSRPRRPGSTSRR